MLVALSGCQVSTRVAVDERSPGHGTVLVAVTFDRSAVAAVGGLSVLSSDLDVTGLAAAGWQVTGPAPAPGSGAVVTASHSFSTDAQAAQLVSSLAGSGPPGSRPFQLQLTHRKSFWHIYSGLTGKVDLTCGLDCFGDSALKVATGHSVGVDPAPLLGDQDPAQIFTFAVQAHLPGNASRTDASTRSVAGGGQILGWTPKLGQTVTLSAETESWNRSSVTLVAAVVGAVLLILLALTVRWIWRRHFHRGVGKHSKRKRGRSSVSSEPVSPLPAPEETVTPPS